MGGGLVEALTVAASRAVRLEMVRVVAGLVVVGRTGVAF